MTRTLHEGVALVDRLVAIEDGDTALIRAGFSCFPSGVAAISAQDEAGEPAVLVASSFQVGISLEPPLVLFAVQHTSKSWPKLQKVRRLGVSILAAAHEQAAWRLASRRPDRFDGVDIVSAPSGATFVRGASAWMETSIYSEVRAGDHDVVLLYVHGLATLPETDPLVWHGSGFRMLYRAER
jgi:flavin reductase (DIM6/NTAB) family NADH-FMN oxidoreductase RutF